MGGRKDREGQNGRRSESDKYDLSGRKSKIPAAYPNTTMVDLQVYVVPREKWILSRRLYRHNIVEEGISLGFVRVLPQLSVHNLRREMQLQLGADLIPRDFTFVRGVGNIFVQLKPKQEMELKVKNFIPPFSTEPEIYMLEVLPQEDSRMLSPLPMLLREDTPPHICHDHCHHSRARKKTVIHVLKLSNNGSEAEQEHEQEPGTEMQDEERPVSTTSCSSQTNFDEQLLLPTEPSKLVRQHPIELSASMEMDEIQPEPEHPDILEPTESADIQNEEEIMQVQESSLHSSLMSEPPTIITTPASARRERVRSDDNPDQENLSESEQNSFNRSQYEGATTERITDTDQSFNDPSYNDNEDEDGNENEALQSAHMFQPATHTHPPRRLRSSRRNKSKPRVFPNPRKPSNYPQRTNKVTLARQALAREKRRVYVEERIQSYIKNAQALNLPIPDNIPISVPLLNDTGTSMETAPEDESHVQSTDSQRTKDSKSNNNSNTKGRTHTKKNGTGTTTNNTTTRTKRSSIPNLNDSNTRRRSSTKDLDSDAQSTPRRGAKEKITTTVSSTTTSVATTVYTRDAETPTPTLNELQTTLQRAKSRQGSNNGNNILPPLVDPNNYYLNHPLQLPPLPKNLAAIPVARVHSHHRRHHQATPFAQMQTHAPSPLITQHSQNQNQNQSFQSIHLPLMSMSMPGPGSGIGLGLGQTLGQTQTQGQMPDMSFQSESDSVQHNIFALPSNLNPDEQILTQKSTSTSSVEHHGYFYSFRVRQSGPVQMMDKCVQTAQGGTNNNNPNLNGMNTNNPLNQNQNHPVFTKPHPLIPLEIQTPPPSQSYTLSFSQTHSSTNDSYVITNHSSNSSTLLNGIPNNLNPKAQGNNSDLAGEKDKDKENDGSVANTQHIRQLTTDDRDKILREIADTVQFRHEAELRRAELVQRANDLQSRVKEKRDKINRRHEFWHKKYIEESSLTRPLEASCSSLRAELNTVHRRLLAHLEGRDLPLRLRDGPSKKANYKIMAARLQHEIKELQQKVKAAKLKLDSELKLKEQADREVREIRNDLSHKKVVMSLARSQVSTLPAVHSRSYDSLVY